MITSKSIILLGITLLIYVAAQHQYCPDTGISYFPHYSNCSLFFECKDGVKTLMECPANYSWAWYHNKCEFKDWVDCSFTTLTPPITTTSTTTTTQNPATVCPSWGFSYLPNYADCHQYYECDSGVETPKECPAGDAWNNDLQACDFEDNVDCSYTTLAPTTTTLGPGDCPSSGQAYLPNYIDCTSFYICENGVRTLKQCNTGYAWNEDLEACDRIENVDCSYTTLTPGTGTTPTKTTGTTKTTRTSPITSITSPFTTTSPANDWCEGQTNGAYIPHPYDCTKFLECMNNNAYIIDCPSGTSWDQSVKQCDDNNDENCRNSTVKPTTTTTTTPVTTVTTPKTTTPSNDWCTGQTNGAYLPHPYDCTKFLECMNEHAYVIDCPAGESWDQTKKMCDDNNEENCRNSTVIPTTTTTTTPVTTVTTPKTTTPANDWCEGETNGAYLPHPYDCTKFLECMNEHAYIIDCPAGESWDQSKKMCDNNNDENCKNSTVIPTTTTTTTPVTTVTTPKTTTPANDWCSGQANGAYLPHPYDCTKFLECMNEHAYIIDCPAGESWDESKKMCDNNNDENCKNSTVIPTTTTTTTPVTTVTTPKTTTPANDWCVGQTNGAYLPHPYDCTKFLECMNDHAYVVDCPSGETWDQSKKTCDTNNEENCKYTSVMPTATTPGWTPDPLCPWPSTGATYYPHPYNCSLFYECEDGIRHLLACESGYLWNADLNECDMADTVDCSYTSTTPAATTPIGNICSGQADGTFLPYPNNCTMYVYCENGVGFTNTCRDGTSWDNDAKQCNNNASNCQ